jgi:DNA anti-recombination protein RmuC
MGIVEDMKRVAEEIVSSYQSRISTVATIIDNTHHLLEDFKNKRNEMSNQLKETLAKEESLRKKDFDNMMGDILSHQDERQKDVKELLKTFFEEQKEIAEIIKRNLSEGQKVRINDFKKMLQDIQTRQKTREHEVSVMLKEFQNEYKEMAESLRSLLDKGEDIRIKDFKEMVKNIRARQIERVNEIRAKLDEFGKERQDMASQWNRLTAVMAEKRVENQKGGEVKEKEEVAKV